MVDVGGGVPAPKSPPPQHTHKNTPCIKIKILFFMLILLTRVRFSWVLFVCTYLCAESSICLGGGTCSHKRKLGTVPGKMAVLHPRARADVLRSAALTMLHYCTIHSSSAIVLS